MSVQQELLQKLGDELVVKFRDSIAETKATGKTAASIHAVSGEDFVEVLGNKSLGALEYGRKPTSATSASSPTLFEMIKEWCLAKGIDVKLAYPITKSIHDNGTLLYGKRGKPDYYGNRAPSGRISGVIDTLNLDTLLRDLTILKVDEYSSEVLHELKQIQ